MKPIPGEITFREVDGVIVATVAFDAINVRFHVACEPHELERAIMGMVGDSEQVRGIMSRTGCLDWQAMEAACSESRRGDW